MPSKIQQFFKDHGISDVEAIIPMGAHPIPESVIAAAPRLRIVAVAAVGYNIVDVAAATRRGVLVTNTPGVLTDTTADMAFALMLGVARRVQAPPAVTRGAGGRRPARFDHSGRSRGAAAVIERPPGGGR